VKRFGEPVIALKAGSFIFEHSDRGSRSLVDLLLLQRRGGILAGRASLQA